MADGGEGASNVTPLTVFSGGGKRIQDDCGELGEQIKAAIYAYSGRIPLAAAIGVLEIVKTEIIDAAKE